MEIVVSGRMTKIVNTESMIISSTSSFALNFGSGVNTKSGLCQALSKTMYAVIPGPDPRPQSLIWNKLQLLYQQIRPGTTFQATCIEVFRVPETGALNAVLLITPREGDPLCFTKTLSQISKDVLGQPYGQYVWKAIAGPEDTPGQNDYRLSVEVEEASSSRVIPQQKGNFNVEQCIVEICPPYSQFTHTVKIGVSVI